MRCRCGNEIKNVPEHLVGLASWVCQQCTNVAPRQPSANYSAEGSSRRHLHLGRKKQAA